MNMLPLDTEAQPPFLKRRQRVKLKVSPLILLTAGVVALKVFNVISIPWVWVFAPVWIPLAFLLTLYVIIITMMVSSVCLFLLAVVAEYLNQYPNGKSR